MPQGFISILTSDREHTDETNKEKDQPITYIAQVDPHVGKHEKGLKANEIFWWFGYHFRQKEDRR